MHIEKCDTCAARRQHHLKLSSFSKNRDRDQSSMRRKDESVEKETTSNSFSRSFCAKNKDHQTGIYQPAAVLQSHD